MRKKGLIFMIWENTDSINNYDEKFCEMINIKVIFDFTLSQNTLIWQYPLWNGIFESA
jgi:hypothetical protein